MSSITVTPQNALVDTRLSIKISGLSKREKVTVKACLLDGKQQFLSYGHFITDENGEVDLTKDESLSGTYTGVDGMGLFWSMSSDPENRRFRKKNVSTPVVVDLYVWKNHLTLDQMNDHENKMVATTKVYRWYKSEHVSQTPIRTGDIRGVLFVPPGQGPYPGVIDLYGVTGGLMEYRAALLASHGFVVLALAYCLHDDLPREHFDISLQYFLDSIAWFTAQPSVQDGGIGILGVSRGAEIGMILATLCSKVKAVISINGPPFQIMAMKDNKEQNISCVEMDPTLVEESDDGMVYGSIYIAKDSQHTQIWKSPATFLNIIGLDDKSLNPKYNQHFQRLILKEKKQNFELMEFPGAGHLIEPPYSPFCRASLFQGYSEKDFYNVWGGNCRQHNIAQEQSWKKILQFFREELPSSCSFLPGDSHSSVTSKL